MNNGSSAAGLAYGTVKVVAHDAGWAHLAADHIARIRTALGASAVTVEHVGSTAVAGLPAKPIVDLAVLLAVDADPEQIIDRLCGYGYVFRGDKGDAGGMLFVAETTPHVRVAHVHVLPDGDPQWARYLAVRDRLRDQPHLADAYANLKIRLAAEHAYDRAAYTAAKDSFLAELLTDLPITVVEPVVRRVRTLAVTPSNRLLLIRRTKPGQEVYWVVPGGGIEPHDASLEDAAHRENHEELGGRVDLHRLVHVAVVHGRAHAIFLGCIDAWDPDARTGPELTEPGNGDYDLEEILLDPELLGDGRIWPVPTMRWLADALREGRDLFTLPDLRESRSVRWRSTRVPQLWTGSLAMATSSTAKFTIAADHVATHGIQLERVALDLMEIQDVDVAAVARHKARQAFEQLGRPVIVEDSAFGLDELDGYPGALVKHLIDAAGARGMAHLADLTATRACTSTAALAYADDAGLVTFTHQRPGIVATAPAGHSGRLPLWTVYIPPGATLPLAAMPDRDRETWQQQWKRHSVFAQFARWYTQHSDRDGDQ